MMFWFRRALAVTLVCGVSLSACALDVIYGSFFNVQGITIEQGRPAMPLTRKKYTNVRILDEETYRWLLSCKTELCSQSFVEGNTQILSLRAAKTRPGMWIAQVAVDQRWLLTFLVFQNPDGFGFVVPDTVLITNTHWREQIEHQLTNALRNLDKESSHEM